MRIDASLRDFTTSEVRDLAWVIQSPGLLNPGHTDLMLSSAWWTANTRNGDELIIDDRWCEQQFSLHQPWLRALDANPQPLLDWLIPRHNPRLGYYFESLVEFWLRHSHAAQHVTQKVTQVFVPHLQVNNDQRTLGEFDYLIVDSAKKLIHHWEVAVKFYLYFQHSDERILWYGPNPRDRLDSKLQRLFQHQLPLSRRPEARLALRQAGLMWPVVPRLFLKGYLFYPSHGDWRNQSPAPGLSPQHLRGWWTTLDRFDIPNADADKKRLWMVLPRLQWLAPAVRAESKNALMNLAQLHAFCLDLLRRHQRPPLIAEMGMSETGDWQEVSRGFVVPQNWPGTDAK